jgi:hypothetical protein
MFIFHLALWMSREKWAMGRIFICTSSRADVSLYPLELKKLRCKIDFLLTDRIKYTTIHLSFYVNGFDHERFYTNSQGPGR